MAGFWKSLLCCSEEASGQSVRGEPLRPAPSRASRRRAAAESRMQSARPSPSRTGSAADSPSKARTRPHSAINHAAIPMDYVNSAVNSTEMALKGRRQSTSILSAPSPYYHPNATTETQLARGVPSDNAAVDGDEEQQIEGPLLPPQKPEMHGRKSLVLDLDETLVHSSFYQAYNADFVIPVEIENVMHDVYVVKRPGVDRFLELMSQIYEIIVFTASVGKYGDPLLDKLDPKGHVHHRLFRESCQNYNGSYVKNLGVLGRPLASTIIVDNSPAAYVLQPFNAVPVSSWFSDIHDNELLDMVPFLNELATQKVPNVTTVLRYEW